MTWWTRVAVVTQERRLMPYGKPPRQLERGRSNRFLAGLPPHDFALLTPHLRTVTLERGTILHDAGDEIERVYFPHIGMVIRHKASLLRHDGDAEGAFRDNQAQKPRTYGARP